MGKAMSTVKGASGGAAAGAALGPWGALIGGVGGGIYGYLTGEDEAKAYAPDPMNFASPTTQRDSSGRAIPGTEWGVGNYWSKKAGEYDFTPQTKSLEAARAMQIRSMLNMYNRANGAQSLSGAKAAMSGQQLMGTANPMMRAGGPAARNAMIASGSQGSQIANQAMMSDQAERLAALGAYQQGASKYFGDEADWFGRQGAQQQAQSESRMNWLGQGLLDKQAQANARLRWERAKMGAYNSQQQSDQQQSNNRQGMIGEVIRTVPSVLSGGKNS